MLDLTAPLELVHQSGETASVKIVALSTVKKLPVEYEIGDIRNCWCDVRGLCDPPNPFPYIRNVAPSPRALLPCPWCGGPADSPEGHQSGRDSWVAFFACLNCTARGPDGHGSTYAEAIIASQKSWNSRPRRHALCDDPAAVDRASRALGNHLSYGAIDAWRPAIVAVLRAAEAKP